MLEQCPECASNTYVPESSCMLCVSCGFSKCETLSQQKIKNEMHEQLITKTKNDNIQV